MSGSGGEYGGMADVTVRRVDFGYFIRPAEETGTGVPRVEPCLGYAVGHPEGMILFDTGMGSHPEVDAHYRPRRVGLAEALAAIGHRFLTSGLPRTATCTSTTAAATRCWARSRSSSRTSNSAPPARHPITPSPNSSKAAGSNQ